MRYIFILLTAILAGGGSGIKNRHAMQEIRVQSVGQEDPLEKEMAIHSSILCLENPMDRGAWRATVHGVPRVGCLRG